MTLPTCRVTATILDQHGQPVPGALVLAVLDRTDRYNGLVAPSRTRTRSDDAGQVVLDLFPNVLGSEGSQYQVTIAGNGQRLVDTTATVPDAPTANLYTLLDLSAPPGLSDAQVAQIAAEAAAAQAVSTKAEIEALISGAGTARAVPEASVIANGRMIAALEGEWVDIPPPSGAGDMQALIYDPAGRATNAFDLSNHAGVLDGGTFT